MMAQDEQQAERGGFRGIILDSFGEAAFFGFINEAEVMFWKNYKEGARGIPGQCGEFRYTGGRDYGIYKGIWVARRPPAGVLGSGQFVLKRYS